MDLLLQGDAPVLADSGSNRRQGGFECRQGDDGGDGLSTGSIPSL